MKSYNKRGFTLVEVLAATIILALITTSVVVGLSFSQDRMQTSSSRDAYGAKVQVAADVIISYLNDSDTSISDIDNETGYVEVTIGNFDSTTDQIQFSLEPDYNGSGLYRITVSLFYGQIHSRQNVEMICYAYKEV